MAHPPHASAAAKSENELFEDEPHSEVTLARDVMRSDGLNPIERTEREAALDENRREEADIFERAASRLRPSWAGADEMLDLGLANALPELAPTPLAAAPVATAPVVPAAFPAVVPSTAAGYASSSEITDGYPARGLSVDGLLARVRGMSRRSLAIAAAVGCVVLGGIWAAASGEEPVPAAPPAAVVPAAPPMPSSAPAAVVAKPAPTRELTREEAAALLGLPAVKAPAKKPAAKLAKAPAKKPPAKKAATKR